MRMKVLLLGVGMQGRAALHDLAASPRVTGIVAADRDPLALAAVTAGAATGAAAGGAGKIRFERVDAADPESLERLMRERPDVVLDLMPATCAGAIAAAAVHHGIPVVNTCYARPEVRALAGAAKARGVAILPEFGLDPGIDLVLTGDAVRGLDSVVSLLSYGGGLPDASVPENPLRYKIAWTFEGVLRAYRRPGQVIRDGATLPIDAGAMFAPENIHPLAIAGLGEFEAYPNGDALAYVEALSLDRARLRELGRFTLRWPGHCAFWKRIVDLHLLDEAPVVVDGSPVDRVRYLAAALAPHLQYAPGERDLVILRIEVRGTREGKPVRIVRQLIDRRDPATGLSAMSRTVGFTASIGAQMLATGEIGKPGLLSPITDVPCERLIAELAARGIQVTTETQSLP
jgi:lysine 6-dehydrogenase